MESANLRAKLRDKSGTGPSHSLRRNNEVPGILYGREINNMLVEFSEMELNNVIRKHGEHAVVNVDINGSNVKTMIKEVQRDPINRSLVHVDMKYIKDDERVHTDVPVIIKGEEYVRSRGGIVQKQLGLVSVETTPEKLPKYFVADVSKLNIGEKLTIADVEFGEDITITSDIHSIIASITTAKEKEVTQDGGEQKALDNVSFQSTEDE